MLQCTLGHVQNHSCLSIQQALRIRDEGILIQRSDSLRIQPKFRPIKLSETKNNIKSIIFSQFRQSIDKYLYLSTCPESLITKIRPITQEYRDIILDNRQKQEWLPLKIMASANPSKGLCVVATSPIPANTLICSYLGQIGTNQNAFDIDDSYFALGFISSSQCTKELIVIARQYCNVGRYFNSANEPFEANIKPEIMLLPKQYNSELFQICIVYITKRYIEANQELQSYYSRTFWNNQSRKTHSITMTSLLPENSSLEQKRICQEIDRIYQGYPIQFRNNLLIKAKYSQPLRKVIQSNRLKDDESEQSQKSQQHSEFFKLVPESQLDDYFPVTSNQQFFGKESKVKLLASTYPEENIGKNLDSLSNIYPDYLKVKGDGNCLFRIIGLAYCSQCFPEQNVLLEDKNAQYSDLYGRQQAKEMMLHLKEKIKVILISEKNDLPISKGLVWFWNHRKNFDHFICSRLRKMCIKHISENVPLYVGFTQNIDNQLQSLTLEGSYASEIVPFLLSKLLGMELTIQNISGIGRRQENINEGYKFKITMFLRAQHYEICFKKHDNNYQVKNIKNKSIKTKGQPTKTDRSRSRSKGYLEE